MIFHNILFDFLFNYLYQICSNYLLFYSTLIYIIEFINMYVPTNELLIIVYFFIDHLIISFSLVLIYVNVFLRYPRYTRETSDSR